MSTYTRSTQQCHFEWSWVTLRNIQWHEASPGLSTTAELLVFFTTGNNRTLNSTRSTPIVSAVFGKFAVVFSNYKHHDAGIRRVTWRRESHSSAKRKEWLPRVTAHRTINTTPVCFCWWYLRCSDRRIRAYLSEYLPITASLRSTWQTT